LSGGIALVGGGGFVGHHLALHLANTGQQVDIIDDFIHNNLDVRIALGLFGESDESHRSVLGQRLMLLQHANISVHNLDASDKLALCATLERINPDIIVHLAAISSAELAAMDPQLAYECGLQTLVNCLDFARVRRVRRFVYLSSSMVYGNFVSNEAAEDHPTCPINIYGTMKLVAERLTVAAARDFDLPYVIIRPSALYGPRCVNGRIAEKVLTQARRNVPLTISGDGSARLDFTCVTDLVDGICLALHEEEAVQQTFNMTFGKSRMLIDLVEIVRTYFPCADVKYHKDQAMKPSRGTLSITKAKDMLGYAPRFDLEHGIPLYLEWMNAVTHGEKSSITPLASYSPPDETDPRILVRDLESLDGRRRVQHNPD
jgi:nucleoside-diphosphate-sugar epimerase